MVKYPMGIKGCHKCTKQTSCSTEEKRKWKVPCPSFEIMPKKKVTPYGENTHEC